MKFLRFLFKSIFILFFLLFFLFLFFKFFSPIFKCDSLIFPYAIHPFDICKKIPVFWKYLKIIYMCSFTFNLIIILNSIFSILFIKRNNNKEKIKNKNINKKNISELNLFIGNNSSTNLPVYINEKSLYQNILITGTIGTGKTSSAMYPFTKQLIKYKCNNTYEKIGLLILDVKGNFYKEVQKYANSFNRTNDVIVIELGGKYKYNPLHKPNLKPAVLANRLKTILTLFSPNNSDSYWIDECEKVIAECIKLCRIYNNRLCYIFRNS